MPTTIKAALKKWEEASGKKSSEAKEIKLIGVYPPIEKMEGPLHILVNCEKLSLSTNLITQIQNLQVLKNLRVLSLGRNLIKSLQVQINFCLDFERLGNDFYDKRHFVAWSIYMSFCLWVGMSNLQDILAGPCLNFDGSRVVNKVLEHS